jgi:hypothetical protein
MAHITGPDRCQLLLLPEAVDDYVAGDNPVRFIEAFVDGLDLTALGFVGTVPKATGRPGYAPADLLDGGEADSNVGSAKMLPTVRGHPIDFSGPTFL